MISAPLYVTSAWKPCGIMMHGMQPRFGRATISPASLANTSVAVIEWKMSCVYSVSDMMFPRRRRC